MTPDQPTPETPKRRKTDSDTVQRRVIDLIEVRLDGAQGWQLVGYVRDQEKTPGSAWFVAPDAKPLAESTVWLYFKRADKEIRDHFSKRCKRVFRLYVARLEHCYARAIQANEINTARKCIMDLLRVQDLMPNPAHKLLKKLVLVERKLDDAKAAREAKQFAPPAIALQYPPVVTTTPNHQPAADRPAHLKKERPP